MSQSDSPSPAARFKRPAMRFKNVTAVCGHSWFLSPPQRRSLPGRADLSTPAILATQKGPSGQGPVTRFALGPTGAVDQAIGGYPYKGGGYGIATYNQFTIAANKANPALYPGAASGFSLMSPGAAPHSPS